MNWIGYLKVHTNIEIFQIIDEDKRNASVVCFNGAMKPQLIMPM